MTMTTPPTAIRPPASVIRRSGTRFGLGLSDCRVLVGRNLRHLMRDPEAFIQTVSVPIVLLLLFRYLIGGAIRTGGSSYIDYVVPGLIVISTGFTLTSTVVGVSNDLNNGIVERFRSMPVLTIAPLVAHVASAVLRTLLSTAVLIGLGFCLGLRVHASALEVLAAAGILLLFLVAVAALAVLLGVLARNAESATGLSMILVFVPYASSALVPTSTMPSGLAQVVRYQPFTPVIDSLRTLLAGTSPGDAWWIALLWWGGLLVLSVPLAVRALSRRFSS
jgi:ABC-2 type transport system permease protein